MQLSDLVTTWPRVCVLHRAHGTRHLHKPALAAAPEWWGEPPTVLPGGAIGVPGLGGMNVTTGTEPDRTRTIKHR